MIKKVFSCFAVLLVAAATVVAADIDLEGVKCVVADKAANPEKSADYKGGKVYFCCGNCAGKFAEDSKPSSPSKPTINWWQPSNTSRRFVPSVAAI